MLAAGPFGGDDLSNQLFSNQSLDPFASHLQIGLSARGPLDCVLTGTVDDDVYKAKTNELKAEVANVDATLAQLGDVDPARGELAVNLFDWTQKAADVWRGSNNAVRRQILDTVCLNRTVGDLTLCLEKRKPFDVFAERPLLKNSRDDRI